MPLCLYSTSTESTPRLGLLIDGDIHDVAASGGPTSLASVLRMSKGDMQSALEAVPSRGNAPYRLGQVSLHAPVDQQDVWAAGVTYSRSRDARMEESTQKDVYDLVYEARRPELFFKAAAANVSGPGEEIGIRADSTWDVPEPELALVLNSHGDIVGYTIGNDVSSRSIEGENPLYLPQAKVYAKSAALGPVIALDWELENSRDLAIHLVIHRNGSEHFRGESSSAQLHRTFEDLAAYLFNANSFPAGAMLMTGTGIIPPSEFTLKPGDEVEISIDSIGSLRNPVVQVGSLLD